MPLFRKRTKSASPAPAEPAPSSPQIPRFAGDRTALRFSEELEDGQWKELHDFLAETADWDMRHFYVNQLADIADRPDWLDTWVEERPDSALPLLFRGAHSVHWAWQARGTGRANSVTEEGWKLFHTRVVSADRDLKRAAALDEQDPTPRVFSLVTARAMSLGQSELRRRYDEVARLDPLNNGATMQMIQGTAKKWGGSHDAMFAFARDLSEKAPEGHSAHKAIALAHVEGWLDSDNKTRYFNPKAIKDEIRAAADRSVRSPAYQRVNNVLQWSDRNLFAWCFRQMGDWDSQLAQMQIIGPWITESPWHFLSGGAGPAYERCRRRALDELAKTSGADR